MSFGGGSQYTLEYVVKVVNQGGASGLNQVSTGLKQINMSAKQTGMSVDQLSHKLESAKNKVTQAGLAMSKATKGMAFGFIGMTTAGAEFAGMLSMYQQVQTAVTEATDEQTRALKESGKESKEYKDATREVADANRWMSMTFRNLMLSTFDLVPFFIMAMNGMMKSRTAARALGEAKQELKIITDGLAKSNIGFAATNKAVDASYISTAKGAKGLTTAKQALTAANISHNGSLITAIPNLTKQRAAMDAATVSTGKLTKAMRILSIAMKIAIPLIALEIGSQAYDKNWGGFRDRINEVGVAIGNTIPQMRGFLDIVKKVGESIVAIFTGNFEQIGDIWKSTNEAIGDTGPTEKQQKAMDELREKVLDLNSSVMDTFGEAAMGDKGERKDFLKSMGLDKGGRKMIGDVLDDFEEIEKGALGLHNALDTMRTLNLMQKFGLDVPNQSWKEIAAGLADIFSNMGDRFPGDDMFDQFAAEMEKASKKKGPVVIKSIMAFMDDNPNFLPFLTAHSPEIAADITTMLNEAGYKVDASGLVTGVNASVKNAFQSGSILDPNSGKGKTINQGGKLVNVPNDTKGGGMLGGLVDKLKEEVKGLPAQIKSIDWSAAGLALRDSFLSIVTFFRLDDPQYLANILRANVIDPIFVAFGTALKPAIDQFKKDPVGFTIGVINMGTEWIANFVAGLLNFSSEEEMFKAADDAINEILAANPFFAALRSLIHDPIGGIINVLTGHSISGNSLSGESVDIDPRSLGPEVKTALGIPSMTITAADIIKWLGLDQIKFPTWEDIKKGILSIPGVKEGVDLYNTIKDAATKGGKALWDLITGGPNIAEGAMVSSSTPNSAEVEGTNTLKWVLPNMDVVPGTITLPPKPGGFPTNSTPTVSPQTAYLAPKTWQVAWPGATFQDPTNSPTSRFFGGMGNLFGPSMEVLKISVPSATLAPETALVDVQSSRIDFTLIATMWDQVVVAKIADGAAALASHWSSIMNSFGNNAESAGDQIRKAFASALQDVYDTMEDLANQWSRFCNSMIANAKSAAKGINKALDSIEDEEVVIHYRATGSTSLAKGGLMSFANGGIMSAAGGKLLTTYGPQLFQIGDNPGGRESVWAIPHDNPGPTVSRIEKMYKGRNGGSSSSIYNQTINLNIKGSDIISDTKIVRKIRSTMGDNMDRFG